MSKNMKGTFLRLFGDFKPQRVSLVFVFVFCLMSALVSVITPILLGSALNDLPRLFSITNVEDKTALAEQTIIEFEKYFSKLGMPHSLSELGIEEKDIDALVESVTRKGTRIIKHHSKDMDEEVMRIIYNSFSE